MSAVIRLPTWLRVCLALLGVVALACAPLPSSRPVGVALALEGLLLLGVAVHGRYRRIPSEGLVAPPREESDVSGPEPGRGAALVALGAITLLALVLRLLGLDTDLWLDEIVTVEQYADRSLGAIFSSYEGANNHLLNSLLVHAAIGAFGAEEWAVRLPALLAGVATVPVLYWVARAVLGRLPSLLAALALAVAYPHVFFSQNARGYAPSLLFGLLSSGLLLRALRGDAWWAWVSYAAAAVLCVVAVPTGGFVLAGHVIVVSVALVAVARRGGARSALPLLGRAAFAYAAVTLVLVQAYAPVVSRASSVAEDAWSRPEAGWAPLSLDFARELLEDATARGPIAAVVALAVAAVGLIGLVSLARRDWALLAALSLGPLVNVAFVIVRGLVFSPRFLLALVFPALLVAVETIRVLARALAASAARRGRSPSRVAGGVQVAAAAVLCLVLALPLPAYYRIPKQPYRDALAFASARAQGGVVVAIYTAEGGVRYYGVARPAGSPLVEGETLRVARTARDLERIAAEEAGRPVVLVTTFHRALAVGRPSLDALVREGWREAERFRGSVGDGDVTVWVQRPQ